MKIQIDQLSRAYRAVRLTESQLEDIYALCQGNPSYYAHMKSPVTYDSIRNDMTALPPGKDASDKYFVGFYDGDRLIAIMDLIDGYPDAETAYIGLFMTAADVQGRGVGTQIVSGVLQYMKYLGFTSAKLGYVKDNRQSEHFWYKNNFAPYGSESVREDYTVIPMARSL